MVLGKQFPSRCDVDPHNHRHRDQHEQHHHHRVGEQHEHEHEHEHHDQHEPLSPYWWLLVTLQAGERSVGQAVVLRLCRSPGDHYF